jgi:hypothetical protein
MAASRSGSLNLERRIGQALLVLASVAAVSAGAMVAQANPMPDAWFFWDVQPWDPESCHDNLQSCYDATPYTEAEGDVEFDLFLFLNKWEDVGHIRYTIDWSEHWQFTEFQSCIGGTMQLEPGPSRLTVDIDLSPPASPSLLGTIRLQVAGRGGVSVSDASLDDLFVMDGADAQAGIDECFCYQNCGIYFNCHAGMPDTLRFEVPQGGGAIDTRNVCVMGNEDEICQVSFHEQESWMTVSSERMDEYTERLTTTIDTAGLPMGEYSGRITAQSRCRSCTTVLLTVTEDLPVRTTSWGRLKTMYR